METGFHVEALLPRVAHRQWTRSLPYSVRRAVVKQPGLLKRLEVWLVKAVWHSQRVTARRLGARGRLTGGGVCFLAVVWQSPPIDAPPAPAGARSGVDFGRRGGGRRRMRAIFATWAKAEARLAKLGVTLPPRQLPQATGPPQLPLRLV